MFSWVHTSGALVYGQPFKQKIFTINRPQCDADVEAQSLLVEVKYGSLTATAAALRNSVTMNVAQERGVLTVLGSSEDSRKFPLEAVYIKVFARTPAGVSSPCFSEVLTSLACERNAFRATCFASRLSLSQAAHNRSTGVSAQLFVTLQ
jgi:hypothetical protein